MRGFGPLSELTRDMSPADRAEVERIKAEMRREGERLAAAGEVGPRSGNTGSARAGSRKAGRRGRREPAGHRGP